MVYRIIGFSENNGVVIPIYKGRSKKQAAIAWNSNLAKSCYEVRHIESHRENGKVVDILRLIRKDGAVWNAQK